MKKELPFNKLVLYAEGGLEAEETKLIDESLKNDPHSQEVVEGLKAIYANEEVNATTILDGFEKFEQQFEQQIYTHTKFSNHLIELNRQLRVAAAVFVLLVSCSFLMGFVEVNQGEQIVIEEQGPYDLAMGSKIAP